MKLKIFFEYNYMDVLELLDTKTLKLIDSSSSYTFHETKYFYFDRDYTDDFKLALYDWQNNNDKCLQKYGHITFWDTSLLKKKNVNKELKLLLLWENT